MNDAATRLTLVCLLGWLLAGCGPRYIYGQTTVVAAPAKPDGCPITLMYSVPTKPYEELGVLAPKDVQFGSLAGGPVPFQEDVHRQVCRAGGEAVVVEKNWAGNYVRGTVIRFK